MLQLQRAAGNRAVGSLLRQAMPASVRQARHRASTTPQAPSLSEASAGHLTLRPQNLETMDSSRLSAMTASAEANWALDRLGSYQAQLSESSQSHRIPMQLLAVVILNELGDIDWRDQLQYSVNAQRGSLGIAQIQVDTALTDQLVDVSSQELPVDPQLVALPELQLAHEQRQRREIVARRLWIPQVAIEASAREIALLLERMGQNRERPWQRQSGFTAPGAIGDAIYAYVATGSTRRREQVLARAVAAAYNSPDIIITNHPERYTNATTHGANAADVAGVLYDFGLFHRA